MLPCKMPLSSFIVNIYNRQPRRTLLVSSRILTCVLSMPRGLQSCPRISSLPVVSAESAHNNCIIIIGDIVAVLLQCCYGVLLGVKMLVKRG